MLGQQTVGIAQVAREIGPTRQTVYRMKGDPAGAEAARWLGVAQRETTDDIWETLVPPSVSEPSRVHPYVPLQ
jgi:hypothetical protein